MPKHSFYKYQGAGNDFVILDNRNLSVELTRSQIERICDRRFGIGADGLMLLNPSEVYDFEMVYFNSDGNESSMCGNGGRCLVKFSKDLGLIKRDCEFMATDGYHMASVLENGLVKLKMSSTGLPHLIDDYMFVDTGSPHVVLKGDLDNLNIVKDSHDIRYNGWFKEKGTNVNFIEIKEDHIKVRTYERGVEDETLACGTGVTAVAIIAYEKGWIKTNQVNLKALGGDLSVSFNKTEEGYNDVYLTGPAEFVYNGEISI